MKISFWKRDKYISKAFRNEKQLYRYLNKNNIATFVMNGTTHLYIGGNN